MRMTLKPSDSKFHSLRASVDNWVFFGTDCRLMIPEHWPHKFSDWFGTNKKTGTRIGSLEKSGTKLKTRIRAAYEKLLAGNSASADDKTGNYRKFIMDMHAAMQEEQAVYDAVNQFAPQFNKTYWVKKTAESKIVAVLNRHLEKNFAGSVRKMLEAYELEVDELEFKRTGPNSLTKSIMDSHSPSWHFLQEMEL